MIKLACNGVINGTKRRWSTWASEVQKRPNGDMAIFDYFGGHGVMGFRKGGWSFRKRAGDYDIYDVDFSMRFQPRRRKAA